MNLGSHDQQTEPRPLVAAIPRSTDLMQATKASVIANDRGGAISDRAALSSVEGGSAARRSRALIQIKEERAAAAYRQLSELR